MITNLATNTTQSGHSGLAIAVQFDQLAIRIGEAGECDTTYDHHRCRLAEMLDWLGQLDCGELNKRVDVLHDLLADARRRAGADDPFRTETFGSETPAPVLARALARMARVRRCGTR